MRLSERTIPLALLAIFLCLELHAQTSNLPFAHPRNRLLKTLNEDDLVTLQGNVHSLALTGKAGEIQFGLAMKRMVLSLQSDATQEAELQQLIADQQDPKSKFFHKFLSPQQFGSQFGVSQPDVDKVVSWLTGHGFTIDEIPAGHRSIVFSGNSDQVADAFRTQIRQYTLNGSSHYANESNPRIPAALSSVVGGIVKLHNFRHDHFLKVNATALAKSSSPQYNSGSSHYLAPADYATIYHISPLYASGIDGSGQTIAIVARSNVYMSDMTSFRTQFGLPVNNPAIVLVNSDPGVNGDGIEATLDAEWSGAVAPKANIKLVVAASTNTADGVDLSAQYIVNNNVAPVVSISYGSCEANMGLSELSFYNSLWQQAAAQGITVFVSSGDSGAAGCNGGNQSAGSLRGVNGLCSSPYSVCVGGTEFSEGSNPGQYWLPGTNGVLGTAQSYIPEVVWNESGPNSGLWAGGGGASLIYPKPSWQNGPGVPADNRRDVPDVSLTAAGYDGYLIVGGGKLMSVGGTSASSPSFAGLMALVNQKAAIRQGNANPNFYALAAKQANGGTAIFHDTLAGNNSVPGVSGFSAGKGYDQASGLGSVDATNLVNHWSDLSTSSGLNLTASASSVTVLLGQSTQITVTAAPTGTFNAAVSLTTSGAPSGMTASLALSKIAAPGSGSITLTLSASSVVVPGTYALTVTGQGGSVTSTAIVSVTVPAPTLSLTASQTAVTLIPGQTSQVSLTTATTGGFNSAVSLNVSGAQSSISASLGTTKIAAPGTGSATLTLSVSKTVLPGTYTVTVTGQGGTLTSAVPIIVSVPSPTLTLTASQTTVTLQPALSSQITLTSTVSGGFNAAVSFSVSGVPSTFTAILTSPKIAAPGSGNVGLTLSAAKTISPGTYNLLVTAQSGNMSSAATIVVTVPTAGTFSFTPNTNYFSVGQNFAGNMLVTVTPQAGFNYPVALALSGLPSGVTGSFSLASVSPTVATTITLTFTAGKTAALGVYSVAITAVGGGITKTILLQLTVSGPSGCTLASNPASLTITAGQSSSFGISCGNVQGGFNTALTLSLNQITSGVSIQMLQQYVVPGGNPAPMAITSSQYATPGTYMLLVKASMSTGFNQTISIPFTVTAPTALLLTPSSVSVTLAPGGTTQLKVVGVHSGKFSATVALSVAGLPAGVTATLSPASFAAPGDGTTTITLKAKPSTQPVSSYFVLAAIGGAQINGVPIGLVISATANKGN